MKPAEVEQGRSRATVVPVGRLQKRFVSKPLKTGIRRQIVTMARWTLTERQFCDLELILNGGFAPLTGFLGQADYESVRDNMRLADGTLWPMPITLDVPTTLEANVGDELELENQEGAVVAVLRISDKWTPIKQLEAEKVFGSNDQTHPAVNYLLNKAGDVYLGGTIEAREGIHHHAFNKDRHTPAELKAHIKKMGWSKVVAFQTRNPLHRAHYEITKRAAKEVGAAFVLNPVVGMTKPGDVGAFSRVRCYRAIMKRYEQSSSLLSLLPLAMRMGGPREAVWHGLIRKNFGFTHFIVGRDHAGPGNNAEGEPFYGPYDSQELFKQHEAEMGITMVDFKFMVYVEDSAQYMPVTEVPEGVKSINISGTELRRRLEEGLEIPEWFSFPEVVEELRREYPPMHKRGVTVFFTGLSGSGKSTIANALLAKLQEDGGRPVTLLDGDIVRRNLSSELGFSKEHRDLNIQRIGFVASEICKNGGIALCAPIAPYDAMRQTVRGMNSSVGGFVLVHVATPLLECEKRDRKGLYALARAGKIKEFTGISDPYEEPADAEVAMDTTGRTPEDCAQQVFAYLQSKGYVL
jgi:sulfate adenylyltransferase